MLTARPRASATGLVISILLVTMAYLARMRSLINALLLNLCYFHFFEL